MQEWLSTSATDANGEATYTYTGTSVGTDVIQAKALNSKQELIHSNNAQKTWEIPDFVVPEFGFGTIAGLLAFMTAIAIYAIAKNRIQIKPF